MIKFLIEIPLFLYVIFIIYSIIIFAIGNAIIYPDYINGIRVSEITKDKRKLFKNKLFAAVLAPTRYFTKNSSSYYVRLIGYLLSYLFGFFTVYLYFMLKIAFGVFLLAEKVYTDISNI